MMNKLLTVFFVSLLLIGFNTRVNAQELTPHPPLFGFPAKPMPVGHWVVRGYWMYNDYNLKYNNSENKMTDIPENFSYSTNVVWGKVRYGISKKMTAVVNVPYLNKTIKSGTISKTGNGLGDIITALRYNIYANKKARFWFTTLLYAKFATGKTINLKSDELPTGTGSFDYGLIFIPEKSFGDLEMRFSASYFLRGKNSSNVDLGDLLWLSLMSDYYLSDRIIIEGSINYKRTFLNSKNGMNMENSDTYLLQILPGIEYRIGHRFYLQGVAPINIIQKRPFGNKYETWFGLYYMI
jgi:hypothetical protein